MGYDREPRSDPRTPGAGYNCGSRCSGEILVPENALEEVINFLGLTPKPQSIAALERLLDCDNDQW